MGIYVNPPRRACLEMKTEDYMDAQEIFHSRYPNIYAIQFRQGTRITGLSGSKLSMSTWLPAQSPRPGQLLKLRRRKMMAGAG